MTKMKEEQIKGIISHTEGDPRPPNGADPFFKAGYRDAEEMNGPNTFSIQILPDEDSENPRQAFCNVFTFVSMRTYGADNVVSYDEFISIRREVMDEFNPHHVFSDRNGGIWYCSHKGWAEEFGVSAITPKEVCEREQETYEQWANGDVWGYRIVSDKTGKEFDACWGFYGRDEEAAKDALSQFQKEEEKVNN